MAIVRTTTKDVGNSAPNGQTAPQRTKPVAGAPPHAVSDIVMGRIQMQFATIAPTLPMIQTGQLRALAVSTAERSITLPDLPTIAEAGVSGFDASLWIAIVMPAGTPPAIVAHFNRELDATLRTPVLSAALLEQGVETDPGPPEHLAARIAKDLARWKVVIDQTKIGAE